MFLDVPARFARRLSAALGFVSLALCALCLISATACGDSEQGTRTQVTARIYIEATVKSATSALRVRSYHSAKGRFVMRTDQTYARAELAQVMDVSFTPKPDDGEGSVLVVADALSAQGEVLVEARATFAFVSDEQRLFELWLYRCGEMELGMLCADPECADLTCLTCVRDRCAATPLFTKPQLSSFDPAVAADPDKLPPGHEETKPAPEARDAGARDAVSDPNEELDADLAPGLDASDVCGEGCDAAASADANTSKPAIDAGALDAELHDAGAADRDTGATKPEDAGSDAERDAQSEPVDRCTQESAWTSSVANAPIPAEARILGEHTNASGALPQYLCRVRTSLSSALSPGKVSGTPGPVNTHFQDGCFSTFYGPLAGRQAWQSFDSEASDVEFQVFTPPSECQVAWVAMSAGDALPARALLVGNTGGLAAQPLYACRVSVTDAATSGTHIGRLGGTNGEHCHVQYYQQPPLDRADFEVLVQTGL